MHFDNTRVLPALRQIYINVTKDALASNTFCPEKYTDPKGARLFCPLKVYSFQLRHVQFDERSFLLCSEKLVCLK